MQHDTWRLLAAEPVRMRNVVHDEAELLGHVCLNYKILLCRIATNSLISILAEINPVDTGSARQRTGTASTVYIVIPSK